MAKLWVLWIETQLQYTETKKWIKQAIPAPFNIEKIKSTLEKLSTDDDDAAKFAVSN